MYKLTCCFIIHMFAIAVSAQNHHSNQTLYPTYNGLVMAGYQGWFRAAGMAAQHAGMPMAIHRAVV